MRPRCSLFLLLRRWLTPHYGVGGNEAGSYRPGDFPVVPDLTAPGFRRRVGWDGFRAAILKSSFSPAFPRLSTSCSKVYEGKTAAGAGGHRHSGMAEESQQTA